MEKITGLASVHPAGVAALLAALAPVPESARATEAIENAQRLDEIIVVAQKREQNLQDVPISVSVWDGDKIAAANIADLQELSSFVPNFTVQDAPITDVIAIRGIQSYLNPGFEQSVGIFSDGVYRGRGAQSRFAFLDVERVEVLRGPQDTLFGNNTIAGALILTSRQPTDEADAEISLLHEVEHEETVWTGHLSGPLTDQLSGRLAFLDRRITDAWLYNPFYDERGPGVDEWAARGTLRWTQSEQTEFVFRYEHGEFDNQSTAGEIHVLAPPLGPDAPNGGVEGELDFVANGGNTSPEIDEGTDLAFIGSTDDVHVEISHTLRSGDAIVGVLAHSAYDFDRAYDADGNPYDAIGLVEREDFEQTSVELRYQLDRGGPISFLGGVHFLNADLTTESFGGVNVVDPLATMPFGDVDGDGDIEFINVIDPSAAALANAFAVAGDPSAALVPFLNDFTRYTTLDQRTRSVALFGEVNWRLRDRLTATLGLRYTNTDKSGTQAAYCLPFGSRSGQMRDTSCELLPDLPAILATAALFDPQNPDPIVLATLASLVNGRELALIAESVAHITPVERDDNFVSGHIGLQWDVRDSTMLFAAVKRGFKAGGFNAFALAPGVVDFDEEEVLSVELGARLALRDGAASINATLYSMDYEDLQVSEFTGNTSFVVGNAAEARIRGIEIDSRWQVTDAMSIRSDLAYNDFEFRRYPTASCTVPQLIQTGLSAAACSAAGTNDLSGRTAPRAPKLTASLSLNHQAAIGTYALQSSLDWSWQDEQYGASDLDPMTLDGSYAIVNFSAILGPADGNWEVSVVAKNLTDQNFSLVADDLPLFPLNYSRQVSRPRNVGLGFRWRFF
ncbi:MAG: TonB-dependent receptor [Pseudomonadota bacterium]